jgi:hypothetical protein
MPHGDLGDQPLEAHPPGRAGPRLAKVVVDHQHPRGRPAQPDRPLHQPVLQPGGLAVVSDLLAGGLAHIHHRQPRKVPIAHLAAQPLPRQQRGHGRPPSPARSPTSTPVWPTPGSRTATTRLASAASHRTAARRLASGSSAQHCLAAHCGARVFPRRPRPALLATRTGSQLLDDLDQPQQPLTSEYRRLPYLVSIHRCILHGRLSRATSRSRASSAGPTSRSALTGRSAATGPWCAARSASAGTLAWPHRLLGWRPRGGPCNVSILTEAEAGRGMSWPKALRRVRGWLTPWVLLQRCWRGWSTSAPPRQLQQALEWVGVGRPLYLYLPP